jgi:hypothetical protein
MIARNAVIGFILAPCSKSRPANPHGDPCMVVLLCNIAQSGIWPVSAELTGTPRKIEIETGIRCCNPARDSRATGRVYLPYELPTKAARGLVPTPTTSRTGFFPEGALDRILEAMDCAMDCQIHRRVTMRHDDGLAAIATRLDHAAFIAMADLAADFVAEVHIYSPDAISKAVQRRMHDGLDMVRKLLAALNVAICSNLDEHQLSPLSQRRPII